MSLFNSPPPKKKEEKKKILDDNDLLYIQLFGNRPDNLLVHVQQGTSIPTLPSF
jgi:hypothetical protein